MIDPIDELRHTAGTDLHWNESYFFTFYDPDSGYAGFFRMGMEVNKRQSNMWCHIMRDGKSLYHRVRPTLEYTDDSLENIEVGGLHLRMTEPGRSTRIGFVDRHLSIDLLWEGFHEAFDFRDVVSKLSGNVAKGHYEQHGAVSGRVVFDGEAREIRGYGFRDHSWGVRHWEGVRNWKAFTGQFGRDFAIAGVDLLEGNGKASCMGFIFNGSENLFLPRVVAEVDDLATPKKGTLLLEDERGGVTKVDVEFVLCADMPHDFSVIHECYVRYRLGDRIGYGTYEINRRFQGAT